MLNIQGKDRKILKKRKRERKEKKRLEAAVKQQKESSGKRRIQINLNCNMVREFHKHAKVMTKSLSASEKRPLPP